MCNHHWLYDKIEGKVTAQCKYCNAKATFFFAPITPKTRALLMPTTRRGSTKGGSDGIWDNCVKLLEARV